MDKQKTGFSSTEEMMSAFNLKFADGKLAYAIDAAPASKPCVIVVNSRGEAQVFGTLRPFSP